MSTNYNGTPIQTLNHIAKDPVILWGCSMAELRKGGLICFLIVFVPIMILLSFIHVALGFATAFISWAAVSRYHFSRIAKSRSDKPLFYDQHLSKKKRNLFIKPNVKYERIKNIE